MSLFKKKYFLPICLAGVLAGYGTAEWIMPRYFHPTEQTRLTPEEFLNALGSQKHYYRQTLSGNYLAGQFAQNHKDWDKANDYMSRVLEKSPDDKILRKHAMVLAMASGRVSSAVGLAKTMLEQDDDDLLAILFVALENFQTENYLGAIDTLNKTDQKTVAAFIVPVLKLWADTAQGKLETEGLDKNSFYAYHAMLAANYLNKGPGVLDYSGEAFDRSETDIRDVEKTADLFAKLGDTEKAEKIYDQLNKKNFANESIKKKLKMLQEDQSIAEEVDIVNIDSPKEGAAVVFLNMAEILMREYSDDSATIFSQMALYLNPDLADGHIIIGNILMRHDRYEEAIEEFQKIKQDNKLYIYAQRQIADLYGETGEDAKAIEILERIYKQDKDIDALIQIGDLYRYDEEYESAVKAYNRVFDIWEDGEVPEKYWHVLYSRGMAYERLKKYEESEEDLKAALKFKPNHPYLLNYLGYSWADQGKHLNQSLDMIKEAALAKPGDGYIADSLGWVYYKMNDFEGAIPHLERAVELLPYDATINDHLGDAYWRVGRKLEAKFQWRRAVNYSEDDEAELKEEIQQKLVSGLPELDKADVKTANGGIKEELKEKEKPAL